jgi:hypothetical protein
MRAREFIIEEVGKNLLFHGVPNGITVNQILKSGEIRVQEPFEGDFEQEVESEKIPKDRISLTRNQYLHFPYGNGVAQFVIDRDALKKYGYKIVPVTGFKMPYKYETEEQVYKNIPVKPPFVIEIQYDPDLEIPEVLLKKIKKSGIKLKPWRKQKPTNSKDITVKPASVILDPDKLVVADNSYLSGIGDNKKFHPATEWYIGYKHDSSGTRVLTDKFNDKEYVGRLYTQIKDRVKQRLSFDDLIPQPGYEKTWEKGLRKIRK